MPNPLFDTIVWFEKAVPQPVTKNVNAQTGVHFEEVKEMLEAMKGTTPEANAYIGQAIHALGELSQYLKTSDAKLKYVVPDPVEMLDALCDQIVTAVGTAHMLGYKIHGGMMEVNASNFSKFVDGEPVFDENRKIQKGPQYFKANLVPYVPQS